MSAASSPKTPSKPVLFSHLKFSKQSGLSSSPSILRMPTATDIPDLTNNTVHVSFKISSISLCVLNTILISVYLDNVDYTQKIYVVATLVVSILSILAATTILTMRKVFQNKISLLWVLLYTEVILDLAFFLSSLLVFVESISFVILSSLLILSSSICCLVNFCLGVFNIYHNRKRGADDIVEESFLISSFNKTKAKGWDLIKLRTKSTDSVLKSSHNSS